MTQLPPCPFGAKCYRKNPLHNLQFSHPTAATIPAPGDESDDNSDSAPATSKPAPTKPAPKPATTSTASAASGLPPCKYGAKCTRKNPQHFTEYSHPSKASAGDSEDTDAPMVDDDDEEAIVLPKAKGKSASSPAPAPPAAATPKTTKPKAADSDPSIPDSMVGLRFAITGTLSMNRTDIIKLINKHGGSFLPSVTKNVTHLLAEDPYAGTSKLNKAEEMGIKVVGEDFLLKVIAKIEAKNAGTDEKADGDEEEAKAPADDAPKPLVDMTADDVIKVSGGSGNYEIKFRGGVYYCTCPAWKNQNKAVDARTCKHLRETLGDEFETWRVGTDSNAPAKVVKVAAPSLLLANKWEDSDPTGWWMSEKLDGVRAYWDGKKFISRLGNMFYAPEWFTKDLPTDLTLDGELFGGRKQFQSTVSIVKSQDQGDRWKNLTYRVFDVPSIGSQSFETRLAKMEELFGQGEVATVELVDQVKCTGKDHLEKELKRIETLGGEGLMLRKPGSQYVGSRSSTLLKVKSFTDEEALIIGYMDGKGKYKGMVGALECKLKNGKTCSVGSGMTDADRQKPPKIGTVITVKYQELTDAGIPRFPTYVGTRIDVKWEDD